jgi:hypothetical protein
MLSHEVRQAGADSWKVVSTADSGAPCTAIFEGEGAHARAQDYRAALANGTLGLPLGRSIASPIGMPVAGAGAGDDG